MKQIIELFISFFKVGIMTFGGGLAMLPILEREIVEKKNWATKEELLDYYAVGQCTPGIIAVNVATFIGHKVKGIIGGIFSTIGVVCPSFIIIVIIAAFLKNFSDILWVQSAFTGIRIGVCALVFSTVLKLIKNSVKNITGIIIAVIAFIIVAGFGISPVFVVIAAIIAGILMNLVREGK